MPSAAVGWLDSPKYDRHLNITGPLHTAVSGMVSEQTVFHGGDMASCLRLEIISKERFESLRVELKRQG